MSEGTVPLLWYASDVAKGATDKRYVRLRMFDKADQTFAGLP